MVRRTAQDGANAVNFRRSLFLTTAIVTLVTAMASMQPAFAQSVTSTGDLSYPAGGPTNPWSVGGNLYVGLFANGTLSITDGGKVDNAQGNIGVSGNSGTVTVSGTDALDNASTWTNSGNLAVGRNGTGELIITAGGQVFSGQGNVGLIQPPPAAPASASGTVTVSGSDGAGHASTWWNSSLLLGPGGGSGTVTIKNGGAIVTSGYGYIGYEHGGDGTVTVSGTDGTNASIWTLGSFLHVGEAGKGTLKILDGGKVSNTDGIIGAQNSSANSTVTVDGPGSSWTNTGFLRVGDQGTNAQLNITGGGTVSNTGTGYIGYGTGSDGTVTVSGSDGTNASTWTNSGNLVVGEAGKGTLKVLDGGKVSNVDGYIGAGSGSIGTVTVDGPGSTWASTGELRVGDQGTGSLTITGGGAVSNVADANIGNDTGGNGTVTVSGTDGTHASTWTNNANLVVGNFGNGTLKIQDGGQVTNNVGYISAQFTGTGVNDHSDVIVSGHDASGNASTWTNTSQLNIGDNGKGNLGIQDGGVVNVRAGAVIGLDSDGSGDGLGTVTVTGRDINRNASTFNVIGNLTVGGDSQDNKLDILNGGVVNSTAATIGDTTFSNRGKGTVTVSGRDANGNASTWNSGNIYVGDSGDGTLNVQDGAAVTAGQSGGSANLEIGFDAGSTGAVNISSTIGNVSRLTVGGSINVGNKGSGAMTVDSGSFVSVRDNVYIGLDNAGSGGTLRLDGGVLETGSVIKGDAATTVLDLNGGILRANRNEADFLHNFTALTVNTGGASFDTNGFDIGIGTDFSGSSTFNKLGLGQLTLTGVSSGFIGTSTVSAGTLAVNGVLGGDMLVDTAGRLAGTGFVGNSVGNNLVNKGVVAPGYGGAMGTLTIQGNYASNGGRLEIATVLGDDTSQTSRLVVNGATIAGSTQVDVINRGGLGAQTVNGIKIIDVAGASDGTFVLNGNYVFQGAPAVIAGAYAYRLYQGGVSTPTDGDWYLRSELLNPPGGPVTTPLYQPGVPIYESYGSNLQSLNTLPTLEQRVGSRFWSAGANGDGNGIWGRTEGTHGRFNPAFSTTDLNQNIDTWKMQAGADRVFVDNASGRLVAGINVSYGNAYSQIGSAFGNGSLKTDGYGLGATLTWYGVQDFYVDAQAQVSRYSSDLKSELRGTLGHDNAGSGEAVSIEAGKRISFGERFGITPQVQMVYSNVQFDRFIDTAGADVMADRNDSFKTRWGVALDHQGAWDGGRSRIYGIANVSYEWLDGARTLVAGTPIINADERLWGELGLGASVTWRKDLTVYGELSGNTPFRGFGNSYIVKGNVGLRAQF